jgi:hypothetical protein
MFEDKTFFNNYTFKVSLPKEESIGIKNFSSDEQKHSRMRGSQAVK